MIKRLVLVAALLLLSAGGFMAYKMLQPPPDDLDLRSQRESDNGIFVISFLPETAPAKIGPIHAWIIEIKDKQGKPVTGAEVTLDGGMPQHGHGLPTTPKRKGEISPGTYRIDGVKFSMSGWWEFKLTIKTGNVSETATFNVVME